MDVSLSRNSTTMVWAALAEHLEAFAAAWDQQPEPSLADHLPNAPANLRQMVLIELIKTDLERRAAANLLRSLDEYCNEFPDLRENGEPPLDLLYEDIHIRRQTGLSASAKEYYERYPHHADALRRLLGENTVTTSTVIFSRSRQKQFAVGDRVDDFEILAELGKGAFGSVFLARQLSMSRLVALKVSADKGTEPQTLAQLDHPYIVRVYDQRNLPEHRLRLLYMQFAPGGTLENVVERVQKTDFAKRTGAILYDCVVESSEKTGLAMADESSGVRQRRQAPWSETVCRIGVQLAQALHYAHQQGVLHRDVKPANVLLATDGTPKLADFNISFSSQLDGATPAAYFGGSLAYMSPEQLEACNPCHTRQPDQLTGQSDLYSLAVVLWELLHGERPFRDQSLEAGWTATLEAMTHRRREETPVRPTKATDDPLALRVERVLQRALSSDPAQRPADGHSFARDLALCLNPRSWQLFEGSGRGWRNFVRRNGVLTLSLITLPTFFSAGVFNFLYNATQWIQLETWGQLAGTELAEGPAGVLQMPFLRTSLAVNLTAYPLGYGLVVLYIGLFARTLRQLADGEKVSAEVRAISRMRCLRAGYCIAFIGLAEWLITGFLFPISMTMQVGSQSVDFKLYRDFFMSQLTCGLVSAGIPFLAATWMGVSIFYPALLGDDRPTDAEQKQLSLLPVHAGYSLMTAAVVPMLALLMLYQDLSTARRANGLVTFFIFVCVAIFVIAYSLFNTIRRNLAALTMALRPVDAMTSSESVTVDF